MQYELRTYFAAPGKMPALIRHMEVAAGIFPKHGLNALGYWIDEVGTSNQITYMWMYESEAARHKSLASFRADFDWRSHSAEEEKQHGMIVERTHSVLMQATPYSPQPKPFGKLLELRVYDVVPGKMQALNDRFANHTMGIFNQHGVHSIGYWTEVFGTSNRLVYMLAYESLAAREKNWGGFLVDKNWQRIRAETELAGPIVSKIHNRLLRPTAYSPTA